MAVFNKTIIALSLVGYKMIIANLALCTSLAIYHLVSNARSWNTVVKCIRKQLDVFINETITIPLLAHLTTTREGYSTCLHSISRTVEMFIQLPVVIGESTATFQTLLYPIYCILQVWVISVSYDHIVCCLLYFTTSLWVITSTNHRNAMRTKAG